MTFSVIKAAVQPSIKGNQIALVAFLGLLAGSCPVQGIAQDSSQDAQIEQDAKVAQDPSDTPLPVEAETDGLILTGPLPPVLGLGLGLAAGVAVEALRPRPAFSCVNRYPGQWIVSTCWNKHFLNGFIRWF